MIYFAKPYIQVFKTVYFTIQSDFEDGFPSNKKMKCPIFVNNHSKLWAHMYLHLVKLIYYWILRGLYFMRFFHSDFFIMAYPVYFR